MCKRLICLTCFILVLGLATGASADLLVHYKFDETSGSVAVDASGNGNDGTINGTPTWVEGTLGNAFDFWGYESVTLPATAMGLTSDIGSVAFWMNADVIDFTGINTVFWAGDNTDGGGFGWENEMHVHLESAVPGTWNGGELSFFAIANPNTFLFTDPEKGTIPENTPVNPILMGDLEWHHVAATWGDGFVKLYIDGELINESAYVSTSYELTNIFIGQMGNGDRKYKGKLDDVRIYSNVISAEKVDSLYQKLTVNINDSPVAKPQEFVLIQNYPNPFNPSTVLKYRLAETEYVTLNIYSVTGKQVATIVNGVQNAGDHELRWNAVSANNQALSSGVYFAKLKSASQQSTIRMMLLR